MLDIGISESQEEKKCPPVAVHDTDNNQASTQPQVEDKPAKVQPVAGWNPNPKPAKFDFEEAHRDYKERRIKGQRDEQRILKGLEGNEQAQDYVKLYFQSASVMWDIGKFRERIHESIAFWESNRDKYGDGKITNYTRSIATAQTVLQALKAVKCE